MKTIKKVTLQCTTEGHNKEYRMALEDHDGGAFKVTALCGKIGGSLTHWVKAEGDEAACNKEYDKILRGQLKKNYVPVGEANDGQDASTAGVVASTVVKQVIARIPPMLCGAIDRATLETYINEDRGRFVLETKWNGHRAEVMKGDSELTLTNKQGQPSGKGMLPKIREHFLKIPFDFTVDIENEPLGATCCVLLDILTLRGKPLERKTRRERRAILVAFYKEAGFDPSIVKIGDEAVTAVEKRAFFEKAQKSKAEGVIVKDNEALYVGGSRDYQWKYKFQKTATFFVTLVGEGGKRNIRIALLDGLSRINCGKVAIPVNCNLKEHNCTFETLQEGDTVEVRFLYCEHGTNKLHQPLFLGKRDDVAKSECQLAAQLPASCYKQTADDI